MATEVTLESYVKSDSSVKASRSKLAKAKAALAEANKAKAGLRPDSGKNLEKSIGARVAAAQAVLDQAAIEVTAAETKAKEFFDKNKKSIQEKATAKGKKTSETNIASVEAQRERMVKAGLDTTQIDAIIAKAKKGPDVKAGADGAGGSGEADKKQKPDDFAGLIKTAPQFIRDMPPADRIALAKTLNDALGYKIPVIGEYTDALLAAYQGALGGAQGRYTQFKDVFNLEQYLVEKSKETQAIAAAQGVSGGAGGKLPENTGSQYIYSKEVAAGTINDLYQSLLSRDATANEISNLFKKLDKEQKDIKNIDKITYKMVNGRQVAVRESKFDAKTFLTNLITGTDEFKNSKTAKETSKIQSGIQKLEQTAIDNGLKLSQNQKDVFSERLKLGEDVTLMQQDLRKLVASTMPKNVQELMAAGNDLADIYSPYRQAMSTLLEVPFDKIDLTDPTLTGAINEKGNMPLYEFQRAIRKDPRWQYTSNAKEDVSNSVQQVLKDFGFVG
jgi:hypothetical protein